MVTFSEPQPSYGIKNRGRAQNGVVFSCLAFPCTQNTPKKQSGVFFFRYYHRSFFSEISIDHHPFACSDSVVHVPFPPAFCPGK
jgi:hypothetical protein